MQNIRFVPSMPFAEYQLAPGINASLLKIVAQKSLAHAKAYLHGEYQPESAVLDFGKCFHALCLQEERLFVQKPQSYTDEQGKEKPWNANAAKCKAWLWEHDDKIALSAREVIDLERMSAAVRSLPELAGMFAGQTELAVFAEYRGTPVKIMVDCLPETEGAPVIDLKTCRNASPEQFVKDAVRQGYHLQAALYLDVLRWAGIERKEFWFVAVESEPPYATSIVRFVDDEDSFIFAGRREYRAAFQKVLHAQRSGRWPAFGSHYAEMIAPAWMKSVLAPVA